MSDADVTNGYSLRSYKYKIMSTSCNDKIAREIFQYMFNIQGNFWFELPINFLLGSLALLTERPLFMGGGFGGGFQFSVTACTLAVLIDVPTSLFSQGFAFC